MACTATPGTCSASCCIPVPLSVSNSLGFTGGHPCCRTPCIEFPPHNVNICMTVNSQSAITIQTGCNVPSLDPEGSQCQIKFAPAPTQNSWGKTCRKIQFSRYVPTGTYIRIRICRSSEGCGTDCTTPPDDNEIVTAKNSLQRFVVDGRDFSNDILTVNSGIRGLVPAGAVPRSCYLKAACIGALSASPLDPAIGTRCCQWYTDSSSIVHVNWNSLDDLPIGTEIVFGPIGQVFL